MNTKALRYPNYGEALRVIRLSHGMSGSDTAKRLGFTPSFLTGLEQNKKRINIDILSKFANLFQTKRSVIFQLAEHIAHHPIKTPMQFSQACYFFYIKRAGQ